MLNVILSTKNRLLGTLLEEEHYECTKCHTRLARQPFDCPNCGCYQVNWIGWQEDRELIE